MFLLWFKSALSAALSCKLSPRYLYSIPSKVHVNIDDLVHSSFAIVLVVFGQLASCVYSGLLASLSSGATAATSAPYMQDGSSQAWALARPLS